MRPEMTAPSEWGQAMDYATTTGAFGIRHRSHWKHGVRRVAAAFGLVTADCATFVLTFLILRLHEPVPGIVLFSGGGAPKPTQSLDVFLLSGIFFVTFRFFMGDYNRRQLFWENARATTITLSLLALADLTLATMIGLQAVAFSFAGWLVVAIAIPMVRQGARSALSAAGLWQIPAALFGTGRTAIEAYASLGDSLPLGFDIRYIIQNSSDADVPPELAHLRRLIFDDAASFGRALREAECAQVVITTGHAASKRLGDTVQHAVASGIGVVIIPEIRGLPLFGLQTNYFFGNDMLLLQVRNNLTRFPSRIVKRLTDVAGSAVLLLLLMPVLLLLTILIRLDSRGPAFFRQARVGRDARLFPCFKFRTMQIDAEKRLADWRKSEPELYEKYVRSNFKLRDDPRVTRAGRWLRRYSLDELPQLLNVLMGHMSLVGPRPLLARELPDYGPAIDLYCCVRPGITGLWQTRGRSDTKFRDRVILDEWYILNWSYWYDVVILLQTVGIVVGSKGAF